MKLLPLEGRSGIAFAPQGGNHINPLSDSNLSSRLRGTPEEGASPLLTLKPKSYFRFESSHGTIITTASFEPRTCRRSRCSLLPIGETIWFPLWRSLALAQSLSPLPFQIKQASLGRKRSFLPKPLFLVLRFSSSRGIKQKSPSKNAWAF